MRRQKAIGSVRGVGLSAEQARARVNRFLLSEVGSQFCADDPELDVLREIWLVPIVFVTPGFVAGLVGEAVIGLNSGEIEQRTRTDQIYATADKLRKRHHAAIEAAFLRARNG
jgi:hypothetical protein